MTENNTDKGKFTNVILHLSQEMHCHVHIAKYPQDFSNGSTDPVDLENISKENEALASEYADAISVLSAIENGIESVSVFERNRAEFKRYIEETGYSYEKETKIVHLLLNGEITNKAIEEIMAEQTYAEEMILLDANKKVNDNQNPNPNID